MAPGPHWHASTSPLQDLLGAVMQSDGGGTIKTLEMVRSVHVPTCAAQYLIDLLDQ
jgi:hypothetical protein